MAAETGLYDVNMIRHEKGKFVLYNKASSKKLGTHDSYDKALKQERAIKMSLRQKLASDISAAARAKLAEASSDSGSNPYIGMMAKLLSGRVPMSETSTTSNKVNGDTTKFHQTYVNYDMPMKDILPALNPANIALHNLK